MERRLAAILAADVVGYSRMMAIDETGTLASPRPYLDAKAPVKLAKEIRRLVEAETIVLPASSSMICEWLRAGRARFS